MAFFIHGEWFTWGCMYIMNQLRMAMELYRHGQLTRGNIFAAGIDNGYPSIGEPASVLRGSLQKLPLLERFAALGLLRSGQPATAERISRITNLLRQLPSPNMTDAHLVAIAEGKGLRLTLDQYRLLSETALYLSNSDEDIGDDRRRHRKRRKNSRDLAEVEQARLSIRKQMTRSEAAGEHLLHLFNHIGATSEHWVAIPYQERSGEPIAGSIRLCFSRSPIQLALAVVGVNASNICFDAIIVCSSGRPRLITLIGEQQERLQRYLAPRLLKLLAPFGIQRVTAQNETSSDDRFDASTSYDCYVDRLV